MVCAGQGTAARRDCGDSHSGVAVRQDAAGQAGQRLDVGEVLRLKGLFLALANLSLRITGNQLDAVEFRFPVLHTHAHEHTQPWTQASARTRCSCTLDRPLRSNVNSIHSAPPQGGQARTTGPRPRQIILSTFHLPSPDATCCTCVWGGGGVAETRGQASRCLLGCSSSKMLGA
jgi:hypothetical protein